MHIASADNSSNAIKRFRFHRVLLVIAIFYLSTATAQFHQYRNYNVKNGLPSSEVYDIMQDSSGYIWFSTDMGVSRFDGYEFINFSTESGLPDNTIFDIQQDSKRRVWFISFSGKLSYYFNGHIHTLPCNAKLERLVKKHFITSLYIDAGDTIWAGTTSDYILKIKPGWTENQAESIVLKDRSNGYLCLIGTTGFIYGGNEVHTKNITVYEGINKKISSLTLFPNNIFPYGNRYSVKQTTDRHFIITVNNRILYCNSQTVISSKEINSVGICTYLMNNGNILEGTYDGVKSWTDNSFNNVIQYEYLNHKVVTAILQDCENNLWFCTEGQGVFCIEHQNFKYYTPEEGLPETKISSVAACGNKVLTGHLDGTISILEGRSVKLIEPHENNLLPGQQGRIFSFLYLNDGEMLSSTGTALFKVDIALQKVSSVFQIPTKKIIASADGGIWALQYGWIRKYNSENFEEVKRIPFRLFADNIYEDHSAKLWICAIDGLWTYDESAGLVYLGNDNPLLSSRIVDLKEDSWGNIWMVTRGNGVIVKKGDQFYHIKTENGLAGNMCRSIFIDPGNIVWIGTNNGLSRLRFSCKNGLSYSINNFSSKNGLLTNEVIDIIRQGDELWAIHNNGISIFDPESLLDNSITPPIYITNTIVNGDTIRQNQMQFEHNQNYFTISFVGLSFKDPGHINYRYKMEGVDSAWVNTVYTSVKYQTLPPGSYRFLVAAQNNDGYWSKKPAEISFVILPSWWQTWLFKIFAVGITFLLLLGIFKIRLTNIRQREEKKTVLQNRIATFELNALRAQMNPHFIFNAINSVQYFITNNDPDSSQKYLSKFAKLIRYVVDNSKLTSIPLEKEIEALTLYLELESLRFEDRFKYEITVEPEQNTERILIPSMLIQPYVENAIWHGIMHKKGNGRINIRLKIKERLIYCMIEDNGIGRQKSIELKKGKNTVHKSIGMSNTHDRLEIINQVNNSNMSVNITDLYDDNGVACGTRVEIYIPSS